MLFIHFMLSLAQTNTFASWRSWRAAVQSMKTEERENVVCVPVSPWRAKKVNLSLSWKKNHEGEQTPEPMSDSVTPENRIMFKPQQLSEVGDQTPGVNCCHGNWRVVLSRLCCNKASSWDSFKSSFWCYWSYEGKRSEHALGRFVLWCWRKLSGAPNVLQNVFRYSLGFKKIKFSWTLTITTALGVCQISAFA